MDEYKKDCNSVIHTFFESETSLEDAFENLRFKYGNNTQSIAFIDKLYSKKEHVCATFTGKYFTAGHTTDQRQVRLITTKYLFLPTS